MSLQSRALSQSVIKYLPFPTLLSLVPGPGGGDQGAWDRELFAVNDNLPGDTGILSEALLVGFSASVLQLEK